MSTRIDRVLQIVLALTLLAAGALKIVDPRAFAGAVARVGVPSWSVGAIAILLPWVEVTVALALLATRRYRDAAEWIALGMLVAFTPTLLRGEDCGCFGGSAAWMNHPAVGLVRNALLIAIAATLIVRRRRNPTSPAGPASPA